MKTNDLPNHWLMIRLSSLGDVVLTTGPLAWWHKKRGWIFTVLTKAELSPLFNGHPAVTNVISLSDSDLALHRLLPFFWHLAQQYRDCGLMDLHGTFRSRLLSSFWQNKVVRSKKYTLERRLFLLSGGRFFQKTLRSCNVPQRYMSATEKILPNRSDLLPCLNEGSQKQNDIPFIAIHPYAAHPNKTWSPDYWQELFRKLDDRNLPYIVIGKSINYQLDIPSKHNFTNKTSLQETCSLLRAASVLITGDSGPMHLASSVGTPVIALFGPTTEEWGFMPEGKRDCVLQVENLPCRPCSLHGKNVCKHNHRCMRDISPNQVIAEIQAYVKISNGISEEISAKALCKSSS